MIRAPLGIAVLAGVLLCGTTVQAADSPETQDIQCMVRASAAASQLPPQGKAVASDMVFYYMGRLVGRNPNIDISKKVKESIAELSTEKAKVISTRCDKELQDIMAKFQRDVAATNAKP
jgi:hypothetical protein